MSSRISFFIFKASLAFTELTKAFIKALILYYFDQKYYIWIKTDAWGYIIGKILKQLTFKLGLVG